MIVTVYDVATGQIVGTLSGRGLTPEALEQAGLAYIEGRVPAGSYIDLKTKEPLPLLTFDLSIETNRVTGIPAGSQALIGRETVAVDDGQIEFDVGHPETITVALTHPIYEPLTIEVPCAPDQA